MAFAVADPYRRAVRNGLAITYRVDASLGGAPVVGAQNLRPTGGNITDTTKPGVRRLLNLELAPSPGLFDALAPTGTQLVVTATVTYLNRSTVDIPMGVFDIDSVRLSEGGGGLAVTAPDKWVRISRARFIQPLASNPALTVLEQITALLRGALGASAPVTVTATSTAQMGAQLWEKDRDKAITDLAASVGAWVFFDRYGVATIADLPGMAASTDWLVDSSATGVMTSLDRERSRTSTSNVVLVSPSSATEAPFAVQLVWDDNPNSPTYAGTDPINAPQTAGPFGIVTYYYDTPLPLSNGQAWQTGQSILARVAGLASQVSLGQVPNPAVDAFDVISVLPPKQRYDLPRELERHFVDTVTHPLTTSAEQQISGRSTRADDT